MLVTARITAQRGTDLRCQGWRQEGLLRMLENVLEVGERPQDLVVYAALGKAARDWPSYERIVAALKRLRDDETLVIQSGKPIGIFKTHPLSPIVIMANCNLVGRWATSDVFYDLEQRGLIAWGGLTAGDWQYIGMQGVIQGTYEVLAAVAREHFNGDLRGRLVLTAGLGGMGSAQPLAAKMVGAVMLVVEVDGDRAAQRVSDGRCDMLAETLDEALERCQQAQQRNEPLSVVLVDNASTVYTELVTRGITPDVVTDQTSAHDLLYGYVPAGMTPQEAAHLRETQPALLEQRALASMVAQVQAMLTLKERGAVVFENGNNIRIQAKRAGVEQAMTIDIFTERYIRPLFCKGIGPFRWLALTGNAHDIAMIDDMILEAFAENELVCNWIRLARQYIPFQGLPARIGWLGHGERTRLGLLVNQAVREGRLSGPIAFTRDHLDAGGMAHPYIGTERMLDGSDAIADWPLLNALLNCSAMADLVAIHSGGGGYAGYMTSSGVTLIADGSSEADYRLEHVLNADTGIGVLRYADAGYTIAQDMARTSGLDALNLE
ncbi:MAG: urocanate hydratase [Chloroflexaceae bacterium]|nr:urocanate hydratase [Chloroflexaceae bacterium]